MRFMFPKPGGPSRAGVGLAWMGLALAGCGSDPVAGTQLRSAAEATAIVESESATAPTPEPPMTTEPIEPADSQTPGTQSRTEAESASASQDEPQTAVAEPTVAAPDLDPDPSATAAVVATEPTSAPAPTATTPAETVEPTATAEPALTAEPATPAPTSAAATPVPTSTPEPPADDPTAIPAATPTATQPPPIVDETVYGGHVVVTYWDNFSSQFAHVVDAARADLAGRTGADPTQIALALIQEVTWSDASLGCPVPGMAFTPALIDGLRVVLVHDGQLYDYRRGGVSEPKLCANPPK